MKGDATDEDREQSSAPIRFGVTIALALSALLWLIVACVGRAVLD